MFVLQVSNTPVFMLFSSLRWLSSPKRVLAAIGVATTALTLARVIVLVVEAYSAVWAERAADRELMQLCESGTGSLSHDFRALCLKKRAEQAAPVLLKALLRAVTTAFTDFVEVLSSPTRVIMLVLFTITGVAAPVVKAMSQLAVDHFRTRRRDDCATASSAAKTETPAPARTNQTSQRSSCLASFKPRRPPQGRE